MTLTMTVTSVLQERFSEKEVITKSEGITSIRPLPRSVAVSVEEKMHSI
jgi:hypothetical protein